MSLKYRYLTKYILSDLTEKMVFIAGPRQVGKTTLAKDIIGKNNYSSFAYYNWDNREDRLKIINGKWQDSRLIILDEFHKYKKWKTHIKGEYDKYKANYHFILTGSGKMDIYRKGGDSLQGRYHYYRLHPFSVSELYDSHPKIEIFKGLSFAEKSNNNLMLDLLHFSGFPEPYLKKSERSLRRWHRQKNERLFREDIRDMSRVVDIDNMKLLADILSEKIGSLFSINSVREDMEVSHRAVTSWLKILESFYYLFRIYPFQNKAIRALKKEPKLYLWDWSEVIDSGARFENFIASHLLKLVHFLQDYKGYKAELFYLRDKEKREVDFLVTIDRKPWFCVEAKIKDTQISKTLYYFKQKLHIPFAYQVVQDEIEEYTKDDVRVISASKFLTGVL